jgi:hypothetical protein
MTDHHDQLVADRARLAAGRDLANWATIVQRLHVTEVPDGVDNLNVDGRRVVGAIQGLDSCGARPMGSASRARRRPRPR